MNKDNKVKQVLRKYLGLEEQYEIYIVWKYSVLQHTKWLLGTTRINNLCYEVTYNGYKDELCIEEYDKVNNYSIKHPFK